MDRIIATNSVSLPGADAAPLTGTPQYATSGNPALAIPATDFPAYQYNAIQEELIAIIAAAGLAPDRTNNAQVLAALQRMNLPAGQCRLSVSSPTLLNLLPYNGNRLTVAGVGARIPGGGVTLSNSGLAAGTVYYVYAFLGGGGALALEASLTGYTLDNGFSGIPANVGVYCKSGDVTRTLVGMIRTDGSTHFVDSLTQRFCLNWFNRRPLEVITTPGTTSTSSTSVVELTTTARCEFLVWGEAPTIIVSCFASIFESAASVPFNQSITIDGIAGINIIAGSQIQISTHPTIGAAVLAGASAPYNGASEGYHYTTLAVLVTSGTGTWIGGGPTANSVHIWG